MNIQIFGTKKCFDTKKAMLNLQCRDQDTLTLVQYLTDEDKDQKVLENQQILKTPIVRNGRKATIGYQPDIWKNWD